MATATKEPEALPANLEPLGEPSAPSSVNLLQRQWAWLTKAVRATGRSRSDLLREAVEDLARKLDPDHAF